MGIPTVGPDAADPVREDAGGRLQEPLGQLCCDPIFVIGQFRSGTTWVYDILTAHPEAAGAFESWMFTSRFGLANLFHDAHFENDLEAFGRPYRLGQLISRERLIDDVRGLAAGWLAQALEPQHRFLVEKTPSHYEEIPIISTLFPGARFVHVIRDGRDVAVSALAAAETWGKGYISPSVREQANLWDRAVRAARSHRKLLGSRYMELRYEDLKSDPRQVIRQLFDFCTMPADDELIERLEFETSFARHEHKPKTQFRRQGQAGEWRRALSFRDCLGFARGSRRLLVELGYEQTPNWWLSRLRPGSRSDRPVAQPHTG